MKGGNRRWQRGFNYFFCLNRGHHNIIIRRVVIIVSPGRESPGHFLQKLIIIFGAGGGVNRWFNRWFICRWSRNKSYYFGIGWRGHLDVGGVVFIVGRVVFVEQPIYERRVVHGQIGGCYQSLVTVDGQAVCTIDVRSGTNFPMTIQKATIR